MTEELLLPAPLWRRLAAAVYDGLLLLAIYMSLLFLDEVIRDSLLGLPVNYMILRALLFLAGLWFFGWFWTHGGQTLGARAWRLKVQRADGAPLHWGAAATRYAVAILSWSAAGLGMLWCLVDGRGRAWHDLAAGTEVLLLPKKDKAA